MIYQILTDNVIFAWQVLYQLGARKFGIVSVPPVGCCPSQRIRTRTRDCYEQLNNLSKAFYATLKLVLQELRIELPEMRYSLGNGYDMVMAIYDNPAPLSKQPISDSIHFALFAQYVLDAYVLCTLQSSRSCKLLVAALDRIMEDTHAMSHMHYAIIATSTCSGIGSTPRKLLRRLQLKRSTVQP